MRQQQKELSKIFLVDDEPANLKLLERMLQSAGYISLTLVGDSRQVLSEYEAERPDLILLDIKMPYVDGYEVMRQLNELNDPLLPPIIVLTAQNDKEHLLRALECGARDFVGKPFDRNELLMRVRNLLEAQVAHRLVHDQKSMLEELVRERTSELHQTRFQVVQRLGMAAEYRDKQTGYHILRMSHISALLAGAVGWSDEQCELLLHASPMHDIGKIGIPDSILLKPGKLDAHEWEVMKTHTLIGAQLLDGDDSDLFRMAREVALTHHEKWDGKGYPYGLRGEEIPLVSRVVALSDVFDALTSERPYKEAWAVSEAVDLIRENSGKHFDPRLVEVFLQELPGIQAIRERFADPATTDGTAEGVNGSGQGRAGGDRDGDETADAGRRLIASARRAGVGQVGRGGVLEEAGPVQQVQRR